MKLKFSLSLLLIFLGSSFFVPCVSRASDETLTITTYYPSPYGVYNQLQANSLGVGDNDGDSKLDSGDVPATAGDVWIHGQVGIGTTTPGLNCAEPGEKVLQFVHNPKAGIIVQSSGSTGTGDGYGRYLVMNDLGKISYGDLIEHNSTSPRVIFGTSASNKTFLYSNGPSSEGLALGTLTAKPLIMGTDNQERMRIIASGNVGIGTNNPRYMLHLLGQEPFISFESTGEYKSMLLMGAVTSNLWLTLKKQL